MKLVDIFNILEKEYPLATSLQFASQLQMHDNSGMLVNFNNEIQGILFTLDLTRSAVEYAILKGINCIITHHPVIFKGIKSLSETGENAVLLFAIANKINILSMHLNADAAQRGIDYYVAEGLGLKKLKSVQYTIDKTCCYGRIFEIETKPLSIIVQECKKTFNTNKIWCFGDENKKICTVASFCGAGIDQGSISFLTKHQVDLVVSSDIKHNILVELHEAKIATLQMTHYANENYGFYKIYSDIAKKLACNCHYFLEENLL